MTVRRSRGMLVPLAALAVLTLGCGASATAVARSPRWACPSPTPRPWGPDGPVKERVLVGTSVPTGTAEYQDVFYQEWEQEYPTPGLASFPSPTPYALVGTSYVFDQRVEMAPLHVTVSARAGSPVDAPGIAPGTQQLYFLDLTWVNHSAAPLPIDYATQAHLRAVTRPDGRVATDAIWAMTATAARLAEPRCRARSRPARAG